MNKNENSNLRLLRLLFALLLVWLTLIWAAPLLVSAPSAILQYMGSAVYFFMDPVCHQLPQRSLHIAGLPMPVCGRCFFIYLGGTITVGVAVLRNKISAWPRGIYAILFFVIVIAFVINKVFLQTECAYLRYGAGLLLGIVLFRLLTETLAVKEISNKKE